MAGLCSGLVVRGETGALTQEFTPSRWGSDDEIGAANGVSAQRVMAALDLVAQGQVHPLGIVIDPDMPAFAPRKMMLQVLQPGQHFGRSLSDDYGWPMVYNDDASQLWWGMGPQIDGLGHLGENGIYVLETMNTGRLAAEGVSEFMFVLGRPRLKGAVQMMINPVAIW